MRKKKRPKAKRLRANKKPPASMPSLARNKNQGQAPANHHPDNNPKKVVPILELSVNQWVSLIFVAGWTLFANHISSSPLVIYFAALAWSIWVSWLVRYRGMSWYLSAGFLCLFAWVGAHVYVSSGPSKSPSAMDLGWQPPELPLGCTNVYLLFGGNSTEMTINEIKTARYMVLGDFEPIKWRVVSNRFYVDVDIPTDSGAIGIRGGQISANLPPQWDMNFNSNAVEIVAGNNNPIYQVFYRRPDQIVVNGFFARGGFLLAARTNGFEWWTGEFNIIKHLRAFHNGEMPTGLKPIFKYPAYKHRGQYED